MVNFLIFECISILIKKKHEIKYVEINDNGSTKYQKFKADTVMNKDEFID